MKNQYLYIMALFSVTLMFQNCSDVSFTSLESSLDTAGTNHRTNFDENAIPDLDVLIPDNIKGGLLGGHFDLDTSTEIYRFSDGETNKHVHEYDDKYSVTYADFFSLKNTDLNEINESVSDENTFVLSIANSHLSPGAIIEINGQRILAIDYQAKVSAYINGNSNALKLFTIGKKISANTVKLTSLKILFEPNAIKNGGLIPTKTSCVVDNIAGLNGEYRNGALTIQALDINNLSISPATSTATRGLLWEATLFWHKDNTGCY